MKKRFLSLLLLLTLAVSLCAAVHADVQQYVFDQDEMISAGDEQILNELGARIYADTGAAVCALLSDESVGENELRAYVERFYDENSGEENGIRLFVNQLGDGGDRITYYQRGERLSSLGDDEMAQIMQAYRSEQYDAAGVHNYMNMVYAVLQGATAFGEVTPEANPNIAAERLFPRVVDNAGVIDSSRLDRLNTLADAVSEKYQCDVAVAFVPTLGGKHIVDYADDFYDYNGYGYGANDDGILLLISVGEREFAETTYGFGKTAFTDYGIMNYLEPRFTSYLGKNDWAGGAEQFINDAGKLLEQARNGQPYDSGPEPQPQQTRKTLTERLPGAALISAIIGFFSGGIPAGSMKRKMKSVERNYGAADYARGGLNLRRRDDRFLYSNVSKTPIPRETEHRSGGGSHGSSVHFSSSGRSHGGHHGKF